MAKTQTLLDRFVHYLADTHSETLTADITLMRYLETFTDEEASYITIRQLGTRFALDHNGPSPRGSLILNNLSMRLQSALVAYLHEDQPAQRGKLWDNVRVMPSCPPVDVL